MLAVSPLRPHREIPMLRRLLLVLCSIPSLALADSRSDWELLKDNNNNDVDARWKAAKSLIERAVEEKSCGKLVPELMEFCLRPTTPVYLRMKAADALKACDGPETVKFVLSKLGQGTPVDRMWMLHLARGLTSPEIHKAILAKGLTDEDADIRRDALQALVAHKHAPALPAFKKILEAGKDRELLVPALTAASEMIQGTPEWTEWEARLKEMVRGKNEELRRASLAVLAGTKDVSHLELFLEMLSHPDWTTRAIAIGFLEKSGSKKAVGAIIEQMRNEPADTRMLGECRATLERLSGGMNFGDKVDDWATWWKNNEETFQFPKKSGAGRTSGPRPRSGTSVPVEYYGIEVESLRVCFILDISGSMTTAMKDGDAGGTQRIDAAKRELGKIIDTLPAGSLFNVISFADNVEAWLDHVGALPSGVQGKPTGGVRGGPTTGDARDKEKEKDRGKGDAQRKKEAEEQKKLDDALRAKAHGYIKGLKAEGGTNIHDALELAFEDPGIDTIFFLTDGVPTAGREVDPELIRAAVKRWNAVRKVKLNTIAVGTPSPLIRQLAADNGGEYRYTE
jgi:HEAT repeat protein